MNETHKITRKSESNDTSPEKFSQGRSSDYIREEKPAYSGENGDSPSPAKEDTSYDEELESKMRSKYARDDKEDAHTGFKNRLVVGSSNNDGLTDFQKAHVKKLQQEREQELYSKVVKESADQVREKWLQEKGKRGLDADDLRDEKEIEVEESGKDRLLYGYSDSKTTGFGGRSHDPGTKFERIENKISNVERDLDAYSKSLAKNVVRQEEKNKDLAKVYEDFGEKINDLKDEIDQSIHGQRKSKREYEEDLERNRRAKAAEFPKGASKSSKMRKSADKYTTGKKKSFKKMKEEIEKLREENDLLKDKLEGKEKERSKKT